MSKFLLAGIVRPNGLMAFRLRTAACCGGCNANGNLDPAVQKVGD